MNSILNSLYFLMIDSRRKGFVYREISFAASQKELMDYLSLDYKDSDHINMEEYTTEDVMNGINKVYEGTINGVPESLYIKMVCGRDDLSEFFAFLDSPVLKDKNGSPVVLSEYLKKAANTYDVEEVISTFNQENIY